MKEDLKVWEYFLDKFSAWIIEFPPRQMVKFARAEIVHMLRALLVMQRDVEIVMDFIKTGILIGNIKILQS